MCDLKISKNYKNEWIEWRKVNQNITDIAYLPVEKKQDN